MRRWGALLTLVVCAACGLFPDLAGLVDGGSSDALDQGFTLAASPSFITMDPGDAPVTVDVVATRATGFADAITLAVSGGVGTISTPAPIVEGGVTSSVAVSIDSSTTVRGDFTFVITGASGAFTAQTKFVLHIGSLLSPDDAGIVVVPQGAHAIAVKAWGGGGGCGSYGSGTCVAGTSFGGGGGYAAAIFDVTGGSSLIVVPATGGASANAVYSGGGGGGFSGVLAGTDWILIAGGGGGGGGGLASGNGGRGGGVVGHAGSGSCAGGGGTATSGGVGECSDAAPPGSSLQGGEGQDEKSSAVPAGGNPGGGAGGTGGFGSGGGGGGGGWFGGAGGSFDNCEDNSGGGGSGRVSDAGRDATFMDIDAANPSAANTTDSDYVSGVAIGCNPFTPKGKPGAPGRVVLRLVKP